MSPHRETSQTVCRFASTKRSARTAKTYGAVATAFLRFVSDDREPQRADVERFLALPLRSGARASVSSYNQALAALRAFAKFAINEKLWQGDPTAGLEFERGESKEPAVLFVADVVGFIRAARQVSAPRHQAKNLALLAVAFTVGLRVSELVNIDISQVDLSEGRLLNVRRKGGRVQNLRLEPRTVHLLGRWLHERERTVHVSEPALFVSDRHTRLSVRAVQRLFEKVRKHVGSPQHVTPHTARHSFVTNELMLGADITVVSRAAGHSSITTTMRYRHFVDTELRLAIGLLSAVIPAELVPANEPPTGPASAAPLRLEFPEALKHIGNSTPPSNDALDVQENLGDNRPISIRRPRGGRLGGVNRRRRAMATRRTTTVDKNDAAQPRRLLLGAVSAAAFLVVVTAACSESVPAASGTGGSSVADAGTSGSGLVGTAGADETGAGGTGGDVASVGSGGAAGSPAGPRDSSKCTPGGSKATFPCEAHEAYVAGKCIPCTPTGEACIADENCSNCCSRLGFDGICADCTPTGTACAAPDCHDCCSPFDAEGICKDSCTATGEACAAADCSDCCTDLGVDGVCVQCLKNSDCSCPSACDAQTNTCSCTDDGSPCAYDSCSDCCSKQFEDGRCTAGASECTDDQDCGPDRQCTDRQCEDVPMAMCTESGQPCDANDCSDCCSGTGADGFCEDAP